jgi:hypothetical protein
VSITFIRKQAGMAMSVRNRGEAHGLVGQPEAAGLDTGVARAPLPVRHAGRGPLRPPPRPARRPPLTEEVAATPSEPEEVLIADPRGALTPAQMVDGKVLALLQSGHPGLFLQAAGRPQDVRRIPEDLGRPRPVAGLPDNTPV